MTAPAPRPIGSPAAPAASAAPVIPTPAAPPLPLSAPPRHRAEAETHHVHEVRLKKATPAAAPSTSSGMPLKVAGSLALVVGIAGGFGYSTYKDLQSRGSETNLSQFDAATPSAAADSATNDFEEMTREFRDQSVAALFQVPAESPATPVPAPISPLPGTAPAPAADSGNPFEVQSEPVPAAKPASSNPFEIPSEPAPAAAPAAEPAKTSTWATRDRRPGTLQRSAAPMKPLPANPRVAAKGDAVLFAPPIEGKAAAPVPAEPILFPGQEEPSIRVAPKPFQRPITDGTAREAVTQIQFEEPAAGATPFAPAQPPAQDPGGFLAEPPASASPNLGPGPGAPVAPSAGSSTVPTFDLGNTGPTPGAAVVSPPTFPAQGTPEPAPAMRRAPAPFAGRDDLHPVPAPEPAPEPAQPVGGASPFAPASQQQPPAWPREEAAPADPFGAAAAAPPAVRTPAVPRGDGQFTGEETVHTVESGENYWTISRKHYGMGRYFVALAEFNKSRIPDPKLLKPGMKVVVPTAASLTEKYAHLISGAAPAKTYAPQTADASEAQAIQQVGFFVDRSGAPVYRVAEGDTLSDVAQTCLGRSSRWVQIYGLNRDQLKSPNDLKLGMLLRLPQDASGVQAAPEASVIR